MNYKKEGKYEKAKLLHDKRKNLVELREIEKTKIRRKKKYKNCFYQLQIRCLSCKDLGDIMLKSLKTLTL